MSESTFAKWLCGNVEAIAFIDAVYRIVELWDDLIDKDKPTTDAAVNGAFTDALITLPRNRFYMQNFAILSPVFESAIDQWHIANVLEKTGEKEPLMTACILRCGVFNLVIAAAKIINGPAWALQVGTEIYQSGDDDFASYCAEHGGT